MREKTVEDYKSLIMRSNNHVAYNILKW